MAAPGCPASTVGAPPGLPAVAFLAITLATGASEGGVRLRPPFPTRKKEPFSFPISDAEKSHISQQKRIFLVLLGFSFPVSVI